MPTPTPPISTHDSSTSPSLDTASQVCEKAPDAAIALPEKVILVEGRVTPAPSTPHSAETFTATTLVEATAKDWVRAMLDPSYGHALPKSVDRVLSFSAMRAGVDQNLGTIAAPYNARFVPAGGQAVLSTARGAPETDPMGIDQPKLEGLLTRERYLASLTKSSSWFGEAVQNQRYHTMRLIDDIVRVGVGKVMSLLGYNARMRLLLEDALEMIKGPAEQAQKSRAENQKLVQSTEQRVRADEQKKLAEKTPAPPEKTDKK